MADYDNTNRGAFFKNDKKETEKHPDFTGSLNVEGKEFWVSGWKRRPDQSDKAPALSFTVKAKDGSTAQQAKPTQQAQQTQQAPDDFDDDFDNDIPW
jgi:hypothetical protein